MRDIRVIALASLMLVVIIPALTALVACSVNTASAGYASGIWDNFNYDRPATYWASAARTWGGDGGLLDLVVAQAQQDGATSLAFPLQDCGTLRSVSAEDQVEPYLSQFDSEGLGVILTIQPMNADINDLIGIILDRYGHHKCVAGINVDMEWKKTGTPEHVSNTERDAWTGEMSRFNPQLKLFLTYFKDYTYFPDDNGRIVVLYDGTQDTQANLLNQYGELAKHFTTVGIYTGYSSSSPPTASDDSILKAAPNTRYIIHTDDREPGRKSANTVTSGLPSLFSKSTGFGFSGPGSKISMPSMTGALQEKPGLLSNGDIMPSAFKGFGGNSRDIFMIAGQDNDQGGSKSIDGQGSGGQKASATGWQSLSPPLDISFTKDFGFGNLTGRHSG